MKTLVRLVVIINIIINLTVPFTDAFKTFEEVQKEVQDATSTIAEGQAVIFEDTATRHFAEGCAKAYHMFKNGGGKYLPNDDRKEAFLSGGPGAGNTLTALVAFIRLQKELIARSKQGGKTKPYTGVTFLVCRKEILSDTVKGHDTRGTYEAKLAYLKLWLKVLQGLMAANSYSYVLIEEPSPLDKEEYEKFENGIQGILGNAGNLAISMDIMVGSGNKGDATATKALFSLKLTRDLFDKNVPTFLDDGRSADGSADYKIDGPLAYTVWTAPLRNTEPAEGLIVTEKTKMLALGSLQPITDNTPNATLGKPRPMQVTLPQVLENSELIIAKALRNVDESDVFLAFDAIHILDLGSYYRK